MRTTTKHVRRLLVLAAAVIGSVAVVAPAATAAPPANTTPPAVTGTAQVGATLTTSNGEWSNTPNQFAYQWQRCNANGASCANIPNANAKTLVLVGADVGHSLRVRVTASNADGSAFADSNATSVVGSASAAPKNTERPAISGTARAGVTLTATTGGWSGNPDTFAFQWQRCDADGSNCDTIVGATAKTYLVKAGDVGFRLRVRVTAKNEKGSATTSSGVTAIVSPATPIRNGRPTITLLSARFLGATVYARFRICDDSFKNLAVHETDSRPGKLSYTRNFATLVPPRPCGVYTRHWLPAARFRGPGPYTLTLRATDKSGLTSLPARRTFSHG